MDEQVKNGLVSDALRALLYEVSVTPKPGLVDPVTHGAHPDMDVFTFIDSAVSLRTYFARCATHGDNFQGRDLTSLFSAIRPVGVVAEETMFQATKGINTHKGAIFSLGILVAAFAYQAKHTELTVVEVVQQMLSGLTAQDYAHLEDKTADQLTAGERAYLTYHVTGIRGEAEAGFPTVMMVGLPALKASQGTTNQRLLDVMMQLLAHSVDTNLIKRAKSVEVVDWARQQVKTYFDLGGSHTDEGMQFLRDLDQTFSERHYSLGGTADLLILTIFVGLRTLGAVEDV